MSLVEQALKKLQVAQLASKFERPAVVVGQVVEVPPTDATTASRGKSEKRIHIDRKALRTAGLLPPEQQERRLAGEYRHIKRPLIAAALGKGMEPLPNGHLIMIASALPGEGKTFTSMNLALSMALEKDTTVLLVDADLAKPHISRTFGVQKEPGLVDALVDSSIDIESTVIQTDINGLSILPAGKSVEIATELLASTRMEEIVTRLGNAEPNRIVLFDSPPLLLTNESQVLANVVGQVVIVVRAGFTTRSAVQEAVNSIAENKPINLVLNQSEAGTAANYYGYGEYGGSNSSAK